MQKGERKNKQPFNADNRKSTRKKKRKCSI